MLAKKTSKNQLTLPKNIVKEFEGIDYFDVCIKDDNIVLTPVRMVPAKAPLEDVRDRIEALGMKDEDIREAIRWARGKKSV